MNEIIYLSNGEYTNNIYAILDSNELIWFKDKNIEKDRKKFQNDDIKCLIEISSNILFIGSKHSFIFYDMENKRILHRNVNKTEEYNTNKNIIHISMAIDNGAVYSSFVSMTSALESNDKNKNILSYHLLLSKDFNMKNMDYFNSLKNNYTFILNYIKIPGIFKSIKKWRSTETVYYKLLIPLLYPDIERMIFLDGDTLIYQDLSEMYNLDFNGTYLLGYPFHTADSLDGLEGEKYKLYINGGVLLFNNFEIRKNNMDLKLLLYTLENHNKNHFLEQDTFLFQL